MGGGGGGGGVWVGVWVRVGSGSVLSFLLLSITENMSIKYAYQVV